jgi:hypothetical protein
MRVKRRPKEPIRAPTGRAATVAWSSSRVDQSNERRERWRRCARQLEVAPTALGPCPNNGCPLRHRRRIYSLLYHARVCAGRPSISIVPATLRRSATRRCSPLQEHGTHAREIVVELVVTLASRKLLREAVKRAGRWRRDRPAV